METPPTLYNSLTDNMYSQNGLIIDWLNPHQVLSLMDKARKDGRTEIEEDIKETYGHRLLLAECIDPIYVEFWVILAEYELRTSNAAIAQGAFQDLRFFTREDMREIPLEEKNWALQKINYANNNIFHNTCTIDEYDFRNRILGKIFRFITPKKEALKWFAERHISRKMGLDLLPPISGNGKSGEKSLPYGGSPPETEKITATTTAAESVVAMLLEQYESGSRTETINTIEFEDLVEQAVLNQQGKIDPYQPTACRDFFRACERLKKHKKKKGRPLKK